MQEGEEREMERDRQTDRRRNRQTTRKRDRDRNRETLRDRNRQTGRQRDRQTGQTETDRERRRERVPCVLGAEQSVIFPLISHVRPVRRRDAH